MVILSTCLNKNCFLSAIMEADMKKNIINLIGFMFLATALGSSIPVSAAEEVSTMMCDGGVVNIGDTMADVRSKCGEPNTQGMNMNQWIYEPGPSGSFTVFFKEGKVERILESH